MSLQQPANVLPYSTMWPWTYHYTQSQLAAQAMNAAALGARGVAPATRHFVHSI